MALTPKDREEIAQMVRAAVSEAVAQSGPHGGAATDAALDVADHARLLFVPGARTSRYHYAFLLDEQGHAWARIPVRKRALRALLMDSALEGGIDRLPRKAARVETTGPFPSTRELKV